MNSTINTCIHILLYFRDTIPNDVIKYITMMIMIIKPGIKTFLNGNRVIIVKDGYIYENNLTDDHNLIKTKHKNVKSICFFNSSCKYEVKYNVQYHKIKYGGGYEIYLSKGELFSVGLNSLGQLGLNDLKSRTNYERISLPNVINFWCGIDNVCALTVNGLYVFGAIGSYIHKFKCCSPRLIPVINVIKASCGSNFGVILCKNAIYGYGPRIYRIFKKKYKTISHIPLGFNDAQNVINISASKQNVLILTKNGNIYTLETIDVGQEYTYLGLNFIRVQINIANIIKVKCIDNRAFVINNKLDIQLWDVITLQYQNINLHSTISHSNVTSHNDTILLNIDNINNMIPIITILIIIITIPIIIYAFNK